MVFHHDFEAVIEFIQHCKHSIGDFMNVFDM